MNPILELAAADDEELAPKWPMHWRGRVIILATLAPWVAVLLFFGR